MMEVFSSGEGLCLHDVDTHTYLLLETRSDGLAFGKPSCLAISSLPFTPFLALTALIDLASTAFCHCADL